MVAGSAEGIHLKQEVVVTGGCHLQENVIFEFGKNGVKTCGCDCEY